MDISNELIYIVLIIVAIAFYYYSSKEYYRDKENKKFIKNNLKIGSKIVCKSGIIAEVIEIDEISCLIASGKSDKFSYLEIKIESIDSIIEA